MAPGQRSHASGASRKAACPPLRRSPFWSSLSLVQATGAPAPFPWVNWRSESARRAGGPSPGSERTRALGGYGPLLLNQLRPPERTGLSQKRPAAPVTIGDNRLGLEGEASSADRQAFRTVAGRARPTETAGDPREGPGCADGVYDCLEDHWLEGRPELLVDLYDGTRIHRQHADHAYEREGSPEVVCGLDRPSG